MVALKDNLVGAWRLVKYEEFPVDGSPITLPLGDRPVKTAIWQRFSPQQTKSRKRIRSPMPAHIELMRNSGSFINKLTSPWSPGGPGRRTIAMSERSKGGNNRDDDNRCDRRQQGVGAGGNHGDFHRS
jgi:hypothetical protein